VKLFAKIGAGMQEDTFIAADGPGDGDSKDAIQLKIDEILRDPKHPYNDSKASYDAHEAAVREVGNLYKKLSS
jgi:hypothetical protein